MSDSAYLRMPAINGDTIAFVTEDDVWTVDAEGGAAARRTAMRGDVARPALSPDGSMLAFSSREEHHLEVYCARTDGGAPKRLTFLGGTSLVVGWTPDGDIVFRSDHAQPFVRIHELWAVSPDGGEPRRLGYGPASEVAFGPKNKCVIGRNTVDPARWKRYRGGTAGHLWIDARGKGTFRRLVELDGNMAHPMWIGERVFFVSDHEGFGNIYSVEPDGSDLRRHTDHDTYYARFASTDGRRVVYQHAAELWLLDPASDENRRIDVSVPSSRTQRARKFVPARRFLQGFSVHPDGHSVALETRGKLFTMPLWEGAVREFGEAHGVRYRLGQWLHDGERVVVISDASGEERLEVHAPDGKVKRLKEDIGRAHEMAASPRTAAVALANHRQELIVVDIAKGRATVIDSTAFGRVEDLAWSPCGTWLAYSMPTTRQTRSIKLADLRTNETHVVTRADFRDYAPAFDPEGAFLYFLSRRTFDPVYDAHFFDLSFPKGSKPYVVTLSADRLSPLVQEPRGFGEQADANGEDKGSKKKAAPERTRIDLEGLPERVQAIPVPESDYRQIAGLKGARVVFTSFPVRGTIDKSFYQEAGITGSLEMYDFGKAKHETLLGGVKDFAVSRDAATLVYRTAKGLRALKAGEKPDEKAGDEPGRASGWIDLERPRVSVDPGREWEQMFGEIWRLQRDQYWTEDMSGVDWPAMRERYRPLLDKAGTRGEFSDLIWEMQGELGTSHAYEMGGDYRPPPAYEMGYLGADIVFDRDAGLYRVARIVMGDAWDAAATSPLRAPGVNIEEGQTILGVNGRSVSPSLPPQALLVNQAGQMVELTVGDAKGENPRRVLVEALRGETPARYRAWVEENRARVHEASKGRCGYVHIPNMGPVGWAEFHRYYLSEVERDALIVDVRFNGGGHVSEIILEKLARKRISYGVSRWMGVEPYPTDSVLGPMVCLTNEHAGSDGDIFTHAFKLMELGPVVGKRTWGGVIGIWPRHQLADGSVTTQPEFHSWFVDVGWGLENYGTDPDHDIDVTPQDYEAGRDPQMDKALALISAGLKRTPALPSFPPPPVLRPEPLPGRKRTPKKVKRSSRSSRR